MKLTRRIRTALYDDQPFADTEIDLLHTPALQRLYDLHQLGFTDRVFIDASHSRLHHVIGVVEQADKMMDAVTANLEKQGEQVLKYGNGANAESITQRQLAEIVRLRRPAVRLIAMLHDVTHAPFGHTLEDEIELVDQKHDEPARQADAFLRLLLQYFSWIERNENPHEWGASNRICPVEDLADFDAGDTPAVLEWYLDAPDLHAAPSTDGFIGALALRWSSLLRPSSIPSHRRVSAHALRGFVRDLSFAMRALLHLEIAHNPKGAKPKHLPPPTSAAERLLEGMLRHAGAPLQARDHFIPLRDVFLLDIIGNTICADLLDYARRDAVNAGLKLAFDSDRIVANMTVVSHHEITDRIGEGDYAVDHPFKGDALRTAVSVFSHKLRTDAPGELIHLLQVRYYVYERVLYHPTKCVAGAMLGAALQWIGWTSLPKHLIHVGDTVFLHQVGEAARLVRDFLTRYEGRYTRDIHDQIGSRLDGIPTGIITAAKSLLADRLGPTKRLFVIAFRSQVRCPPNSR
jgi:HD superfamily phosphohydrolase